MFKEFIKSRPILRKALGPVIKLRNTLSGGQSGSASEHYRNSVVGGVIVVSPANIRGRFHVAATSHLASRVALRGEYEPEVTDALRKLAKKDGAFVNIGANVGFFSVFAAEQLGYEKVIAIEPNPEAFELLEKNVAENRLQNRIAIHRMCVAKERGELQFTVIAGKPEFSSIGGIVHPSVQREQMQTIPVAAAPLAEIIGDQRVAMLFVDTEGAEDEVFSGAEEIIRRDRPILFFECADPMLRKFGSSSEALEAKLRSFGYDIRNGLAPALKLTHPYEGEALGTPV